ncbi:MULTISPECIES: LLM class flavin-dependent oxidoreductase [Oscillospiraceae]
MSEVVRRINEQYGRQDSVANLSNKLTRGTLKYREAQEIAEVIGYRIEWVRKDEQE